MNELILKSENSYYDFTVEYDRDKFIKCSIQRRFRTEGFVLDDQKNLHENMYGSYLHHTIENIRFSKSDSPFKNSYYSKHKYLEYSPIQANNEFQTIYEVKNDPEAESEQRIDEVNVAIFEKVIEFLFEDFGINLRASDEQEYLKENIE